MQVFLALYLNTIIDKKFKWFYKLECRLFTVFGFFKLSHNLAHTPTEGSLDAMDAGHCRHVISDFDMLKYVLAQEGGKHCDKGAIGGTVLPPMTVAIVRAVQVDPC